MAKKKAKRYTTEEKDEILKFIEDFGRGGMTAAVKKYKVTPATIYSWKKKFAGGATKATAVKLAGGSSKELKNLQALAAILSEIEQTEAKLAKLQKQYKAARAKL